MSGVIPAEREAAPSFTSTSEAREVMERALVLMRDDPEVGPRLRALYRPHTVELPDQGLVVNIRSGGWGEPNLVWTWTEDVPWTPQVRLIMNSDVANRYLQGRENLAVAIARRRIRAVGNAHGAVRVLPILRPVFERYRTMILAEYPHLAA